MFAYKMVVNESKELNGYIINYLQDNEPKFLRINYTDYIVMSNRNSNTILEVLKSYINLKGLHFINDIRLVVLSDDCTSDFIQEFMQENKVA